MASSSTSSVPKSFKYDVFLSFRGEDTRKSFVDHLYHALERENIETYKDDEKMVKGERICDELINAIEDSRFYIIVFSKSYASSSWCLDELVKIMECLQGTTEQKAYPVFYDVEPTEVRKQSGAVAEAFARRRMDKDAGKWRKALEEAAGLAGFGLKNTANGHEAQFIQEIVKVISHELNSISFMVDEKLIGMETRIKGIISSLELGFVDVRMLGIKGMGGGGKTTLARAVFDQISHQFEGKSFVEDVREVSKSSLSGLKSLQEKILSNVLGKQIDVNDVHDGKKMMKRKLCGRKVLVVLDDVDLLEQLEALAGESNWFKSGSRIIITTRDEQVLIAHEVPSIRDVNLLSNEEAICLFNRFAFRIGEMPSPRFKELSQKVVRYAAGLPLTIRVLGSNLKGKDEDEWKDTLESLKKIPLEETLQKLELSFMGLQRDHKDIFLDVVCFWKGEKKDDAIIGLESCQLHAKAGLSVLERKSLITVSEYGRLEMHDSIQEMGWDIVRRDHRDEPERCSRLWDNEEIENILTNELGSEATRGIKLFSLKLNPSIVMKGLKNMKKLRFLHVSALCMDYNDGSNGDGTNDEVSQYFPNALQYLNWRWYPFSSLPITFQASNLVGLRMSENKLVQLWEGGERKVLPKLRFLELTYSRLIKTLDLEGALNLETLYLLDCSDLVEVQMPAKCRNLKFLHINGSKLTTLDLEGALNLESLDLEECSDLVELQMPAECPKLKTLSLSLSRLKLKTLRLRTPNLERLNLKKCFDLVELHMLDECPKLTYLSLRHSKLRTFNLMWTPNLETLDLKGCYNLVKLDAPIGCLKKITKLNLSGCSRFEKFGFFKKSSFSSPELKLIVKSIDICPLHPDDSNLPKFRFECYYDEGGPSLIGNLEKLISVGLCACTKLEAFYESICDLRDLRKLELIGNIPEVPKDLGRLGSLEELMLSSTQIKHLPDSICMLKHLKFLKLESCWHLEKLPKDLGQLECLETLSLQECYNLVELQMPFECLQLKSFDILTMDVWGFSNIKSFELGKTSNLETLSEYSDLEEDDDEEYSDLEEDHHLGCSNWSTIDLRWTLNLKMLFIRLSDGDSKSNHDNLLKLHMPNELPKLKSLELIGNIPEVPKDLGRLGSLEELMLSSTEIKHLPDSICSLQRLKFLKLESCWHLEKLPEDLGRLECLETLSLSDCIFLRDIPKSICKMKYLKDLHLSYCLSIKKLPEELGHLVSLKELRIEGTGISHLPHTLFHLTGVSIIGSDWLLLSCGLTPRVKFSKYVSKCNI